MSLDFLSKDFNWGGGGSSSLGKICFLQIVKPGKFGEEEKQAVLLKKKKKKKKKGLLELAFLEKNKTKQNPTFFHEAFFFKSICPRAFFPTYPCLSFKTNIYPFLLLSVRKFL